MDGVSSERKNEESEKNIRDDSFSRSFLSFNFAYLVCYELSKNFNPSQTSHGHPLAKSYLYFPLCVLLLISPYHVIKAQFRQPQHRSLVPSLLRRPRRNQNKSKRASLIARHSKIQLLLSYLLFILNNFKSYAGEWSL